MYLHIIKNIQFTRNLKVNGLVREFNFRKISGPPDELFHVDVVDDRGNRIMFRMQKTCQAGLWRLKRVWIKSLKTNYRPKLLLFLIFEFLCNHKSDLSVYYRSAIGMQHLPGNEGGVF